MYVFSTSPVLSGVFAQQSKQKAGPINQLISMLNDKAADQTPLETAKQALLDAKEQMSLHL